MTTTKRRINITADKDVEKALIHVAKRDGVPTASKAADLLRVALELEEDLAWAALADQRMSRKNVKYLTHKQVWG